MKDLSLSEYLSNYFNYMFFQFAEKTEADIFGGVKILEHLNKIFKIYNRSWELSTCLS